MEYLLLLLILPAILIIYVITLNQLAKRGNLSCQYILGKGAVKSGDLDRGKFLLGMAAAKGHANSCLLLGETLMQQGEAKQAKTYFILAGGTSNKRVQFCAAIYLEDMGEIDAAAHCYQQAYENGCIDSLVNLSILYAVRKDGKQDFYKALELTNLAIAEGCHGLEDNKERFESVINCDEDLEQIEKEEEEYRQMLEENRLEDLEDLKIEKARERKMDEEVKKDMEKYLRELDL